MPAVPEFLAILDHDAWEEAVVVGGATAQEAEDAAIALLLEETREFRDEQDEQTDEEWVEVCLSESWTIRAASFR